MGFNVGTFRVARHQRAFFESLHETGASLVRMFLEFRWDAAQARYAMADDEWAALPSVLQVLGALNLQVVLVGDFESAVGASLWSDKSRKRAFIAAWEQTVRFLANTPGTKAYDLLNEPNPPWSDGTERSARTAWRELAEQTLWAIRGRDTNSTLIFEGVGGGQAVGLRHLEPFAVPGVVYSLHFYQPHAITHQRVNPRWSRSIPYPTVVAADVEGTDASPGPWNAERLRAEVQDVVTFQQQADARIFVGEFSCVRWAPGDSALRYIQDCVDLFADLGWSWCYHEFRGWPGWDSEVASQDPNFLRRSSNAPVMAMLRNAMTTSSTSS